MTLTPNTASRRGFTLIGLLIVLAIIAILYYNQNAAVTPSGLTQAQVSIAKSEDTACLANRAMFQTNLQMFAINYPGERPTMELLAQRGYHTPGCPDGGTWTILEDGVTIHCSKHAERHQQIIAPGSEQAAPSSMMTSGVSGGSPSAAATLSRVRGQLGGLQQGGE